MRNDIEFVPAQQGAVEAIMEWFYSYMGRPFVLTGYAGTGKTTVLAKVVDLLTKANRNVYLCAPTGKAASVLASKVRKSMFLSVGTLHSLLYNPPKEKEDHDVAAGRELVFTRRHSVPADIIIVDEASMLQQKVYRDVLAFGKPVLLVGDSFQLPPVKSDMLPLLKKPDYTLEEVFRQAYDNPIIRLATDIRTNGRVPEPCSFKNDAGHCKVMRRFDAARIIRPFERRSSNLDTVMLCYTNHVRHSLNRRLRAILGYGVSDDIIVPGEKVVLLSNDSRAKVYNGEVYIVDDILTLPDSDVLSVRFKGCDERIAIAVDGFKGVNPSCLISRKAQYPGIASARPLFADYGYAISGHKAQGSEWDNVVVYGMKPALCSDEDFVHWLYTCVTRARKNLLVLI